ncbi:SIMPL domain-containing protein [Mycolicibacterium sp. P9-22]|uniref:SIMPL domain-containing protein n=1 Tax=Mycolicibacterium sp. P9-22 TaxID=2024613 RepID=UPI0011EECE6B|nr:SIMPL domain-containing protein [Mycolicibacterium sp. P9-22]KAA0115074.1 SIMPL domain-containing protein [Mycolicibacterium sp. P9-22]
MSTEITVRGSFSAFQSPERGIVHASISYHGPDAEWVYDRVARDLDVVKQSVLRLKDGDNGAVTWWSAQQLRTWTNRPTNKDGEELPLVHVASVGTEVKFRDFTALSQWVGGHVTETEGFEVSYVRWALTSKSREELITRVRTGAVRDAAARAQLYADALELGTVRPIAIADAGMLGAQVDHDRGLGIASMDAAPPRSGGSPDVELVPEDIRVSATVEARFVAGEA